MKKKRVLLLNLPLPDYYKKIQKGNTQLFQDYVKCIADVNEIEIISIPRNIFENYNNHALYEEIIKRKPDIVGFSSYLWNIERNIPISKKLMENGIITVSGGPEITSDNSYILKNNYFSYYFEGQSEYSFVQFLSNADFFLKSSDNYFKNTNTVDFNDFINKYPDITTDYRYDGLFYLEVERGCPFKCIYCAYNKFNQKIKSIDFENFKKILKKIYTIPVKEVYLLAPTLNRDKKAFNSYLDCIIAEKNKTGKNINFFGELRAELLTDDEIKKLAAAGFNEIEFGIQSLNKNTFNSLERGKSKFDFINFSKKLLSNNIKPMIDFIAGLPHDTYDNMMETVELLDKNNLLQHSNFYHLHVLANTELRKIFNENKFIYDKKSPYFSYQVDTLSFQDIQKFYFELEDKKGLTDFIDYFDYDTENFYMIRTKADLTKLSETPFYHTSALLYIDYFDYNEILYFYNDFFSLNPEIFHKLFIYSEKKFNPDFLTSFKQIFSEHKNYYDLYKEGINFGLNSGFSKVFHILLKPDENTNYIEMLKENYFIDFIIFPEEESLFINHLDRLKKVCNNEGSYLYLFKKFKDHEDLFIRFFPKI